MCSAFLGVATIMLIPLAAPNALDNRIARLLSVRSR